MASRTLLRGSPALGAWLHCLHGLVASGAGAGLEAGASLVQVKLSIDSQPGVDSQPGADGAALEAEEATAAGPAPSPNMVRTSSLLQAHSLAYSNAAVALVLACVCLLPLAGRLLDRSGSRPFKSRPYTWTAVLLVVASYAVWLPGIFSQDFSLNIGFIVPVAGTRLGLTKDEHNHSNPGPVRETTRSFVRLMWMKNAKLGAVLMATYAFAVPITKLVLLAVAEIMRSRENPAAAKRCLIGMKLISKWAAPDMFGMLLLYSLVRHVQHLPVNSVCVFDVGFTCYSVFALTCAVSSVLIPLPEPHGERAEAKAPRRPPLLGASASAAVAMLLAVAWAPIFLYGISEPCFSLRLDSTRLKDHVPAAMSKVMGVIKLENIVATQKVSLVSAAASLWQWFCAEHELNLLLGFAMLAVFAVAFTVLSVLCCGALAWAACRAEPPRRSGRLAEASHVLKHLAMMDVFSMGVVICTLAGASYRADGIVVELLGRGLGALVASEALHLGAYHLAASAASLQLQPAAGKAGG